MKMHRLLFRESPPPAHVPARCYAITARAWPAHDPDRRAGAFLHAALFQTLPGAPIRGERSSRGSAEPKVKQGALGGRVCLSQKEKSCATLHASEQSRSGSAPVL